MKPIWDERFLKERTQDARTMAEEAQSDSDWLSAAVEAEQAMSDAVGGFEDCQLPGCRRAKRCLGNKPVCALRCGAMFEQHEVQELFWNMYAAIQQERCNAAAQGLAADVIEARTDRVHRDRRPRPIQPAIPPRQENRPPAPEPPVPVAANVEAAPVAKVEDKTAWLDHVHATSAPVVASPTPLVALKRPSHRALFAHGPRIRSTSDEDVSPDPRVPFFRN